MGFVTGGVHFQMIKSARRDCICTPIVCVGRYVLEAEAEVGNADTLQPSDKTLKGFLWTKMKV